MGALSPVPGVHVSRVDLSFGSLDVFRFVDYEHAFPRHSHDRFTIGVFGAHNGSITLKGSAWPAGEGSILAIAPDEVHSAEPRKGSGWTYRTLYPSAEIVDAATAHEGRSHHTPVFGRPVLADPGLARDIRRLHEELETTTPTLATEERMLHLVRSLIFRHGALPRSDAEAASAMVVRKARAYLEENYSAPIRVRDLSRVCGMSPWHLIRCFRDSVGVPPHAYLTGVRASRARDLLRRGHTVSSAAYACGFSDQSHLTRTFKKVYGITPGAYAAAAG